MNNMDNARGGRETVAGRGPLFAGRHRIGAICTRGLDGSSPVHC